MASPVRLTRRTLIAGAAAGGGLLVAFALLPRDYAAPLAVGPGEHAFGAWLRIGEDGVVTVAVPQLEMGQGVTTVLPQLVAMELGADWRQVAVEPAPPSGAFANLPLAARWAPLWRPLDGVLPALTGGADDLLVRRWAGAEAFCATAEGTTLAAYEQACREAGAAARAMLCMAAAERWDVAWQDCDTTEGLVVHPDGEERLGFGALAEAAARSDPPDPPPLRPVVATQPVEAGGDRPAYPRLDLPAKVDGSLLFAADVRLPDMLHAAIRHGPQGAAELTHLDLEAAQAKPGLVGVIRGKRFLAALGETWWAADRALDGLAPRFAVTGVVESAGIDARLEEALASGNQHRVFERGGGIGDDRRFQFVRRYDVAPALHAPLETASATARFADGRLELWIAAQAPEQARHAAAAAIGLSPEDVVLYPMPAGGSFDRRLDHGHAIEAALIAREAAEMHRRPVQLTWSRWQELLASHPRMPAAAVLGADLAADGRLAAWRARIACPPTMREMGHRLFGNLTPRAAIAAAAGEADPLVIEGLAPPYAVADLAIDHVPVVIPLPTARMRGGAHGLTCFMVESFIDELAREQDAEPISFRIAMLGTDPRLAACLQRAAQMAGWDGGATGSGQGVACHAMPDPAGSPGGGGRIAVIAEAAREGGGIRTRRLVAAVDIGRIVNRDIALQQIEGGLLYGLALATGSATRYEAGLPNARRLADLALPTLAETPQIEVALIESDAPAFDPGEIGVVAVAPALANALHSATGLRFRRLPLISALA